MTHYSMEMLRRSACTQKINEIHWQDHRAVEQMKWRMLFTSRSWRKNRRHLTYCISQRLVCVCSAGTDWSLSPTRAICAVWPILLQSGIMSVYGTWQKNCTTGIYLLGQLAFNHPRSSSVGPPVGHHLVFHPNPVWSSVVQHDRDCIQKRPDCSFCATQHLAVNPREKITEGTSVHELH